MGTYGVWGGGDMGWLEGIWGQRWGYGGIRRDLGSRGGIWGGGRDLGSVGGEMGWEKGFGVGRGGYGVNGVLGSVGKGVWGQ